MAGVAAEAAMITASAAVYLLYHAYFFIASGLLRVRGRGGNLFAKGRVARVQFCELVCSDDDTIAGIQQNRNCLLGVSFLAGTSSILAQKVLSIILDTAQLEQIRAYGADDPLTDRVRVDPTLVLGVNFLLLMASIMAFSQAVRMYIHAGFFLKAGALPQQSWVTVADAAEVTVQAQVAQTVGMRTLFFFPVTAMWILGPTAMLITSVVTTVIVAHLDHHTVPERRFAKMLRRVEAHTLALREGAA